MKKILPYILHTFALLTVHQVVFAESTIVSGSGALSATARVDFTVIIPKILYLRVGTGANMANNATIDLITFNVPAASIGNGTAVAGTGGDLLLGSVTARVIGNNGSVTLSSSTPGALSNGSGDSISYTQISTATAVLVTPTALPAPALADGSGASIVIPAVSKIVNQDAKWTYTYLNTAVVPPGTYGGVNVNNGRATYTAALP